MVTKKAKTFNITGRMWVEVNISIPSSDIASAIEASKELKIADFITINGDHNDSSLKITGIFEDYIEPVI